MKSNAKQIRHSLSRTKVQAATYAAVSMGMIGKIERGEPTIPLNQLINLAYSYGVSVLDLYPTLKASPGREMRFDHEIQERVEEKKKRRRRKEAEAKKAANER